MSLLSIGVIEQHRRGVSGVTSGSSTGSTGGGTTTPTDPATPGPSDPGTGNVTPFSAMDIWQSYGVQGNPTRYDQPYAGSRLTSATVSSLYSPENIKEWIQRYYDMGVYYVRMKYNPTNAGAKLAVEELRAKGMKALMVVISEAGNTPTGDSTADTRAAVKGIATNAPDVCIGIEGINEPQYNRATNPLPVPADWGTNSSYGVIPHQKAIREEIDASTALRGNVLSVASSMQDNAADASYDGAQTLATKAGCTVAQIRYRGGVASVATLPTTGRTVGDTWMISGTANNYTWSGSAWVGPVAIQGGPKHFHYLVDNGMLDYVDIWGNHTYPGPGDTPLGGRGGGYITRANRIWAAAGDGFPLWNTEWGYSTATANATSGHAIVTEEAAATYGPRALLEFYAGFGLTTRPSIVRLSRFEGVDDYDAGDPDTVESNFGIIGVSHTSAVDAYNGTLWRSKPEVAKMKAILQFLKPPDGTKPYTTTKLNLTVNRGTLTDLRYVVVQKHDATVWLFYWRNALVSSNQVGVKKTLTVTAGTFTYTDANGAHTVSNADGEVRWVQVYR